MWLKFGAKGADRRAMGTVGISFGSPTSGQGFDVSSTVSQIVANLQAVETPWQTQLSSLQAQDTALTSIGNDLSTLSNALASLTAVQGVLSEKEGSSSDESVLTLTGASSSAVAGSNTITVNSLAATSSYDSTATASGDTLAIGSSFAINGQTITIDSSNDTLSSLATAINNGQYGVTANVLNTSAGQVLSLVSQTSGAAGDINVTNGLTDASGSAINFTQAQAGADASLTLDNFTITSPSNTVTDAIPGVTMQLLSAAPNTAVQVEITNNNTDVETAVTNFVSAYNTVIGDLNTQEGHDSSGNPEPLFGNPTVSGLQEQLQQALDFTQPSGALTSLTQLGVSVNNDGTLSLDSSTLSSELNSNYQDVVNFFQTGNDFTSFGDNLTSVMNTLGNGAPNGEVFLGLQQYSTQESTLNTNISNENALISTQQSALTTELNEANFTLEEIPTQLQAVNEIYSAITGYNQNPNG
jgi:flagellar hook-associated protein 2